METQPHALIRGSRSALLPFISLAFENFLRSHLASLEHNAASVKWVLPTPSAKIRIILELAKENRKNV